MTPDIDMLYGCVSSEDYTVTRDLKIDSESWCYLRPSYAYIRRAYRYTRQMLGIVIRPSGSGNTSGSKEAINCSQMAAMEAPKPIWSQNTRGPAGRAMIAGVGKSRCDEVKGRCN